MKGKVGKYNIRKNIIITQVLYFHGNADTFFNLLFLSKYFMYETNNAAGSPWIFYLFCFFTCCQQTQFKSSTDWLIADGNEMNDWFLRVGPKNVDHYSLEGKIAFSLHGMVLD